MTRNRTTLAVCFGFLLGAAGFMSGCPGLDPIEEVRDIGIQVVGVASSDGHTVTYTLVMNGSDGATQPNGNPADPNLVSFLCPVTLSTTLPVGAMLISASGNGWDCAGSTCVPHACTVGQTEFKSPGGLPPVSMVVTVIDQGPYENCATISNGSNAGGWTELSLTNNTSCVTTIVPPPPPGRDLVLTKLGVLSTDGLTIKYTISLTGTNGGTPDFTLLCPVTITDVLPPGATLVSSSGIWSRTGSTYLGYWCSNLLGFSGWGSTNVVSFPGAAPVLDIVASVPPGETITNCASITNGSNVGAWTETNLANNTSCVTNTIPAGGLSVKATLDGNPWTGPLNISLAGSQTISVSSVPLAFAAVTVGTYTMSYVSGGPAGASLLSTTPATTQTVTDGGTVAYLLNFRTNKSDANTITVKATLDGVPWAGPVSFTVSGPQTMANSTVPQTSGIMPAGVYSLAFTSGGPPGATFLSVTPSASQTLTPGTAITFVLNFYTQSVALVGDIVVDATQLGAAGTSPWSGLVNYTLTGPQSLTGTSASQTFANVPVGIYTLTYTSGGPSTIIGVTPSSPQPVTVGGTTTFTLNF